MYQVSAQGVGERMMSMYIIIVKRQIKKASFLVVGKARADIFWPVGGFTENLW